MTGRASRVQIETKSGAAPESGAVDVDGKTKVLVEIGALWKGAALVAALVLAVAAILPNLLPKTYTIATQSFVDESVETAKTEGMEVVAENTEAIAANTEAVGAINVTLEGVVDGQHKARASAEAERVTRSIRKPAKRVQEYERVRRHAERNLKARPAREPLDGVDLNF